MVLTFYSDNNLNVTIRFQEQIQQEEWKFTVEPFKDFRKQGKQCQVLNQWLDIDEPVRERMDIMWQDVPKLLRAFLDSEDLHPVLRRTYQSLWV
jgi:hypothetical protein